MFWNLENCSRKVHFLEKTLSSGKDNVYTTQIYHTLFRLSKSYIYLTIYFFRSFCSDFIFEGFCYQSIFEGEEVSTEWELYFFEIFNETHFVCWKTWSLQWCKPFILYNSLNRGSLKTWPAKTLSSNEYRGSNVRQLQINYFVVWVIILKFDSKIYDVCQCGEKWSAISFSLSAVLGANGTRKIEEEK